MIRTTSSHTTPNNVKLFYEGTIELIHDCPTLRLCAICFSRLPNSRPWLQTAAFSLAARPDTWQRITSLHIYNTEVVHRGEQTNWRALEGKSYKDTREQTSCALEMESNTQMRITGNDGPTQVVWQQTLSSPFGPHYCRRYCCIYWGWKCTVQLCKCCL